MSRPRDRPGDKVDLSSASPGFIERLGRRVMDDLMKCQEYRYSDNHTPEETEAYLNASFFVLRAAEYLVEAGHEHVGIAMSRRRGN